MPVVLVPVILDKEAISKLEAYLHFGQQVRYIKPSYVFLQQDLRSQEEVLAYLARCCKQMVRLGRIFLLLYTRESMAPTSFGNFVAVPHPIEARVEETLWVICTLKQPIDWAGKQVRFVCLLCIEKDSDEDFTGMYQQLVRIIEEPEHVQKLLKAQSYEDFHKVLVSI